MMLRYTDGIYRETKGNFYYIPYQFLNDERDLIDYINDILADFKCKLPKNQIITEINYERNSRKVYIYIAEVANI